MAAKTGDSAKQNEPQKIDFTKVKIKDRGNAVEHQRIGEVTVGTDANGQVAFVDFGGADIETE